LTLLLTRCAHQQNPLAPEARELTALEKQLVESDNKFGLKLFKEINRQEEADKNIFISPLSVSMALGMTLNGAAGETQAAMEQTLEFAGMTTDDINQSYRSLIDLLTNLDRNVAFEIGNSIWYREGMAFEQSFIDVNKEFFDAVVRAINFNHREEAARIMNSWVKEKTRGKISEIVKADAIDANTVMFLINAIYFKGTWTFEFKKENTRDDVFTKLDGSQIPCKMMNMTGTLSYVENDLFQAVDLPYGNQLFSMTIFLPKLPLDVNALLAELTQENWEAWLASFDDHTIELQFPKFTLEYKLTMNDVLKALGMEIAFDKYRADFTRMYAGPERLFIDEVIHKTFVKVDEEGTEAAAVTSVEIGVESSEPSYPLMRVDRPFLFVIRDQHSNTILFMGKIVEPKL
jgi:serpin B